MPAGPSRIYEENKVAWFGVCCPIVDQENKSPISFPLGFVGGFPTAAAIKMNDDGCKKVADANGDLPVAEVFHNLFLNGWKSAGRTDDGAVDQVPARARRLQLAGRPDTRRHGLLLRQPR